MAQIINLSRPMYSLREAAGLAGVGTATLVLRLNRLFGQYKWGVKEGNRWLIPAGTLRRYFDKGGTLCPGCWRLYSTPKELRLKLIWERHSSLKRQKS